MDEWRLYCKLVYGPTHKLSNKSNKSKVVQQDDNMAIKKIKLGPSFALGLGEKIKHKFGAVGCEGGHLLKFYKVAID